MSWEIIGNTGTNPAANFLGTKDDQPLVIKTNALERMRISVDGNVGVGTTTPRNTLGIRVSGAGEELISFEDPKGTTKWHINQNLGENNPGLNFAETGIADGRLFIQAGSNVGVGTTTPRNTLGIRASGAGEELISFEDPKGTTKWHINQNLGGNNPGLNFAETGIADGRLFIQAGGNVGIGTTTPSDKLTVNGNVSVTGDVILTGADCAEEFDMVKVAENVEPGTVMVINQEGALQPSEQSYDKKVAGVISGAGDYKPGLILDRQQSQDIRLPVALVGKVYCKVDAQYAPVEIGDLLTTSPTPGHAMKADDPVKAFGAVIGKALRRLSSGQGLVPILVALQ